MRALVLHGPGDLRLEEVEPPRPPRGWLLLRSVAVGICGTDKAFYRGSYRPPKLPLVPGHEAAGLVVAAPPEWRSLLGRLVVPEINMVSPEDMWREPCRSGLYIHCPAPVKKTLGIDYDGALAEYFVAPPHLVHVVDDLEPEAATAVEPLAAVLKAFRLAPPRPGDRVAVIGTGFIALLAAQVLRSIYGIDPVVVARRDSPKKRIAEQLGLRVLTREEAEEEARRSGRWGMGFDQVFEATGTPEGLSAAVELARPQGVVHVKSTHGLPAPVDQTRLVVNEVQLVPSRCGTSREFQYAIELIRSGRVRVRELITSIYWGLDRGVEAFQAALRRESVKVVVRVSRTPWELGWRPTRGTP